MNNSKYLTLSFPLLLLLAIFHVSVVSSQVKELNPELIAQNTTFFNIKNESFESAEELLNEVRGVQFIALGEIHGSKRLSEFTNALLIEGKKSGFENLALEVGPYSAEKLEDLVRAGPENITNFYKRYSSKVFGTYPIPFFINNSDLDFLATADSFGYNLWGLDQEFAFSTIYLLDEIVRHSEPLTKKQKELHAKVKNRLNWWYKREQIFPKFNISCKTRDFKAFQELIATFDSSHTLVSKIIEELNETLTIYCMAENGMGKDSNIRRVTYFYNNFAENLKQANLEESTPKVILKMGSYHMGRDASPLNIYDIGNYVHKVAEKNGTRSLHLRFLNRFFENGDDKVEDKNWTSSRNFISVGRKKEWALIDLRPLRAEIQDGSLAASEFEKREILNYDFIIVLPLDNRKDKHY